MDPSEEIIVITGGASGLGLVVAEFYAMRGSTVAVIDIQPRNTLQEAKGIAYYQCDVGNAEHVNIAAKKIQEEVCQALFQ